MNNKTQGIKIHVNAIDSSTDTKRNTRAYLFDRAGNYISSVPIGDSDINFEVDSSRDYRISIGPDLINDREKPPLNLSVRLVAAGATSKDIRPDMGSLTFDITRDMVALWLGHCINVHGTVTKQFTTGGTAPITVGTVQIFLIDFYATFTSRYSAAELITLRDEVGARLNATGNPANIFLAFTLSLLSGSALALALAAERTALWPYWCGLIPEWKFAWSTIGETPINSDGTFSYIYCYWGAAPDLYFEVVQTVNGAQREISDPDLACAVFYNYNGTTSVDILVTDQSAIATLPGGPDLGFEYCWPTAIGNMDLSLIDGLESAGTGLTYEGLNPVAFGGTLPLQMMFSPNLRSIASYYRWSYRFDDETDFTPIHNTVSHRWQNVIFSPLPTPHFDITLVPVTFGPQVVGPNTNLFEIPDPAIPWIDINDPADRPFAYFDSTTGVENRHGMCTLMLELFDASGNFLSCDNIRGINTSGDLPGDPAPANFFYLLPEVGGPPMTYTNAPVFNITDHGRLTFSLFIDNRRTTSSIGPISVPTGTANDCGFLIYDNLGQSVHIGYSAIQPGNFIDWGLNVIRGSHGSVASTGNNTTAPIGSSFNNTVSFLLGTCVAEGRAAFAVNLNSSARITNGYGKQTQYDSSATTAFALAPI